MPSPPPPQRDEAAEGIARAFDELEGLRRVADFGGASTYLVYDKLDAHQLLIRARRLGDVSGGRRARLRRQLARQCAAETQSSRAASYRQVGPWSLFATPRVEGVPLSQLAGELSVSVSEILQIAFSCTRALMELHAAGLIHGNLKPSNIILHPTRSVVLIDGGGAGMPAHSLSGLQLDSGYILERVLPYLAPEQTGRVGGAVGRQADFYSLGVSLYELLVGMPPFRDEDPLALIHAHIAQSPAPMTLFRPDVPIALSELVGKLMEKEPKRRHASTSELFHELEACTDHLRLGRGVAGARGRVLGRGPAPRVQISFAREPSQVDRALDFRALISACQGMARELEPTRVFAHLMRAIVQNAGAQRAALVLERAQGLELVASVDAEGVELSAGRPLAPYVCGEALRLVQDSKRVLLVEDVAADERFALSPYVLVNEPRSMLCMPVAHAESLQGFLYLDNSLTSGSFSTKRLDVLEVLLAQAAISHDNAVLYARSRATEQRLRKSREGLRATLNSIGDAVIATDAKRKVTVLNPVAEQLLGWSKAEAKGKRLDELLDTLDTKGEPVHPSVNPGRGGPARLRPHRVLINRQGQRRSVSLSAAEIRSKGGLLLGYVLVLRDITELQEMQQQLHHRDKLDALGRVAGGLAHDLKNMLGAVMNASELISLEAEPKGEIAEYAEMILDTSERAAELTRQFLTFARKEAPKVTPIDLNATVGAALDLVELAAKGPLELVRALCDPPLRVLADASQLHSAVLNLGLNACHAMAEGGTLTVCLRRVELGPADTRRAMHELGPGSYAELSVNDTGTGIPPELVDKVFEPFFTTKPAGVGTGLGLAAVHGTVLNHGGAIELSSELGVGTEFRVLLPILTE